MPPKKRENEPDTSKNPRIDHIQADHELFLQAFEKPTQIYRFLGTRNSCYPIFLNRSLTYMKHRMSRTHKSRQSFKIDDMLERVEKKDNRKGHPEYINLTFLGFASSRYRTQSDFVQVETSVKNLSYKKRKDCSATTMQFNLDDSLGTADVPINPPESNLPLTVSTISISTESFYKCNGPLMKSFILVFTVKVPIEDPVETKVDEDEPAAKKIKSSAEDQPTTTTYTAELTIYDKYNRCYLSDGDYEIVLEEVAPLAITRKKQIRPASWENVKDLIENYGSIDAFMKVAPVLKFKLNWSSQATAKIVERPQPYPFDNKDVSTSEQSSDKLQIVYQFVYNNNSRQQTEACEDLHCPWCALNCNELYTLLKHLKLCHSRFTFTYVPINVGARIDIAINEMYDGSYTGSPHDLIMQPSTCAFSRNGPVRRASVTHILVCHPKRPKPSLSEFLELDDCEYDGQRPFITGHNRLYHHTTTCLPIYPKEMDVDSEGENDPEWLQSKTMMMIDEFTDVNEGEKELMKMWNLHVMKYCFVGDCQIPLACQMFVEQKGKEVLLKNLYRNFVVHLSSLFDFGLISAVCLYTTLQKLQQMIGETNAIRNVLKHAREAQIDNFNMIKTNPLLSPHNSEKSLSIGTPKSSLQRKAANIGLLQRRSKTGPTPPDSVPVRRQSVALEGAPTKKR